MPPVSDLRDTRVLVPRVRRTLEGIEVLGSATSSYSDEAVNNAVADSIAAIILYTGTFFGKRLEVVERDPHYQAPVAWRTSEEITEAEASLVAIQASLDHVYRELVGMKSSQTIRNEGQEWSYSISANVLTERLKGLREDRDRALEMLLAQDAGMTDYVSFIEARDARLSRLIEPWVGGVPLGGQELDARGFL